MQGVQGEEECGSKRQAAYRVLAEIACIDAIERFRRWQVAHPLLTVETAPCLTHSGLLGFLLLLVDGLLDVLTLLALFRVLVLVVIGVLDHVLEGVAKGAGGDAHHGSTAYLDEGGDEAPPGVVVVGQRKLAEEVQERVIHRCGDGVVVAPALLAVRLFHTVQHLLVVFLKVVVERGANHPDGEAGEATCKQQPRALLPDVCIGQRWQQPQQSRNSDPLRGDDVLPARDDEVEEEWNDGDQVNDGEEVRECPVEAEGHALDEAALLRVEFRCVDHGPEAETILDAENVHCDGLDLFEGRLIRAAL
mmetsp:Transcript_10949/g.28288  ORF Transcript_10949/g.28288 Transcript_10949/m.28288 type:complete len:305 (-) Transcript_10949:261-1175(-)